MKLSSCLSDVEVRALIEGGPGEVVLARAEQHVLECDSCLARLKQLTADTQEWSVAPASKPDAAADELMQRLEALWPADATVPPDATPGHDGHFEQFAPPEMLGPFRVQALLGAGGVGLVYAAQDTELSRLVAIKVLRPEHARNPLARRRFVEEARAVAALANDHIVPIYRVGEEANLPYIAMPLLEGRSLADELSARTTLPVAEAIDIARQVATALAAAHERNIIHRDIKPGNIWLEANGRVKILDFGLARFIDSDTRLTQTGLIVGTPAYMAPEQAEDGGAIDHRTDLFSLGCVMFQMLSGKPPFAGKSALAVFKSMAAGNAKRLAQLDPAIPEGLSALVARLLERDRNRRPKSATEVLQALETVHVSAPRWHRRRALQTLAALTGATAISAAGIGGWKWITRPPRRGELSLTPGASATVSHGLMDTAQAFTMECWLTPLAQFPVSTHVLGNSSFFILGQKGMEGMTNAFELVVFLRKPPADAPTVVRKNFFGAGIFEVGRRIHIAALHNLADFRIFIDGQLVAAHNYQPYISVLPSSSFFIGSSSSTTPMRFDEVRVSNIARYHQAFSPVEGFEPDEHTTVLYRCDETEGDVLIDLSKNTHHATIQGPHEWVPRAPEQI